MRRMGTKIKRGVAVLICLGMICTSLNSKSYAYEINVDNDIQNTEEDLNQDTYIEKTIDDTNTTEVSIIEETTDKTSSTEEINIEDTINNVDSTEIVVNEDVLEDSIQIQEPQGGIVAETVSYSGHIQDYGDVAAVNQGTTLGYPGEYKRLEAITVNKTVGYVTGDIECNAHVQDYGWMGWKKQGEQVGVVGESKRLEALQIRLTGELGNQYDVYYRMYISKIGWLDWAKNGEVAGTMGYSCVAEAVEIQLVNKNDSTTITTNGIECISENVIGDIVYSGHVQNIGDVEPVSNKAPLGTVGKSLRIEGINIDLENGDFEGGLSYRVHVQDIGWQASRVQGEMAGTSGQGKRLEAIEVSLTGTISNYCDVWYRLHIEDYGWLGWAKNGENAGSAGLSKRVEAIEIVLIPKGGKAPGANSNYFMDVPYGQALVNMYADQVISQVTNSSMSQEEKLRACYNWVVGNCTYQSVFTTVPAGYTFDQWYGVNMFQTHKGNCYSYAAAFYALAIRLGYNAQFMQGNITKRGGGWTPHGWVRINGYNYDTQMENRYGYNGYGPYNQLNYQY